MSNDLTQYVTPSEAAILMGVTPEHVRLLIGRKKIRAKRLGHAWLVYRPSIDKYDETKSRKGRPRSREPQLETS